MMGFFSDVIGFVAGNEAADAQADAIVEGNQQSNQTLMRMFEQSNQLNAPTRVAGDRSRDEMLALMGMAPTSGATGAMPGVAGGPDYAGYVTGNEGLQNAFNGLRPQDIKSIMGRGYDANGDGRIDAGEYGNFHYTEMGQSEGRSLPTYSGTEGTPGTLNALATGEQDAAYDRFQTGGFARSMLETTQSDMDNMMGAFGAGGTAMSGSTLGALNDRNRSNTNAAFTQHWNALGGLAGQGTQVSAQQGQNALAVGQQTGANIADSYNARGSSYANRAIGLGNLAESGVNALGQWFGGA